MNKENDLEKQIQWKCIYNKKNGDLKVSVFSAFKNKACLNYIVYMTSTSEEGQ